MVWRKPKACPAGLTPQQWSQLPDQLTMRVVRITAACRRAFRKRRIDIVTTLLDPLACPPQALGELYRERWLAELNLRSLKTTLGMDVLRCRSPEMVRKERALFHVVYNLIRVLMMHAARVHDVDPQHLSFAGTRQRLLAELPRWLATRGRTTHTRLLPALDRHRSRYRSPPAQPPRTPRHQTPPQKLPVSRPSPAPRPENRPLRQTLATCHSCRVNCADHPVLLHQTGSESRPRRYQPRRRSRGRFGSSVCAIGGLVAHR
ncbi:MAG: transposase [Planctomycetes bacterium]|nr:transposase [Planctomycetota bacterium]